MKKLILALLCMTFTLSGVASKNSSLIVKGIILQAMDIDYSIQIVNKNGVLSDVQTKDALKFYKLNLELGHEYKVTFTKGDIKKVLFVSADAPGLFPMDIDFGNDNSARLTYNYLKRKYELKALEDTKEYTASRHFIFK